MSFKDPLFDISFLPFPFDFMYLLPPYLLYLLLLIFKFLEKGKILNLYANSESNDSKSKVSIKSQVPLLK